MSTQDKTLQETVAEALSGNDDTANAANAETNKGISGQETAGETHSGGTPEFVSGIDISDIPEQDRPRLKELLSKKAKLLEDGYQGKFKEVAEFKRAQEELVKAGLSTAEARDVLNKHIESKRSNSPTTTSGKKEALKTLDKLLNDAPYEQRSALEQMRTIILEETDIPEIKKKLEILENILGNYHQSAMDTRKKQVESELVILSEKYGKDLVEKYRDVIVEKGVQYPKMNIKDVFKYEVPIEEIEQAILSRGKKPLTKEKKDAISSSGSGVTSATEKIDVKKSSFADILMSQLGK